MHIYTAEHRAPIRSWVPDNELDAGTLEQADNVASLPFIVAGPALMPDAHLGYGVPIGCVFATRDVILPGACGVDIGCGMRAVRTNLRHVGRQQLEDAVGAIRQQIPTGTSRRQDPLGWEGFCEGIVNDPDAPYQLGTLGGGNHFLELQKDRDGFLWIMIHSGSRGVGHKVAMRHLERAKDLCSKWYANIPDDDLAFLPLASLEGQEYLREMDWCLRFAKANRHIMAETVLTILGAEAQELLDCHHNYVAQEHHFSQNVWVHRKGAIRARVGDLGIIPGSMGTSSYITTGKGHPLSFCSSSHGAGRRMSRKQARKDLDLTLQKALLDAQGILHGMTGQASLDEAPGAYKDIYRVMEQQQQDLTGVVMELVPVASVKG